MKKSDASIRRVGSQTVTCIRYSARMTSTPSGTARPTPIPSRSGAASPPGGVGRPSVAVAEPETVVWYLAICHRCGGEDFAEPFRDENERDAWAAEHVTSAGHTVQLTIDGFDDLPGLHMTGVVRRDDNGQFRYYCPADECQRENGPYGTAQAAIASWFAHIPQVTA